MRSEVAMVPLDRSLHGYKTWKRFTSYQFAATQHWVPIAADELAAAAVCLPLVYRRDTQGWQVMALLGLEESHNVCVDDQGRWRNRYVPAALRSQPFLVNLDDPGVLCIDEGSEWLIDGHGGEALFDDQGNPASFVRQTHEFLKAYAAGCRRLGALVTLLDQAEVLCPLSSPLLDGLPTLYGIDETRWYERLGSPLIGRLARGVLPLVYAQLISQTNLELLNRYRDADQGARSLAEPANPALDAFRNALGAENAWAGTLPPTFSNDV